MLYNKIIILSQELIKLVNESFIIYLFYLFTNKLLPLKEYLDYYYNQKNK